MTDALSLFIDHMRAVGCAPADTAEIIDDDKARRFRLDGDKPKTRNASYQLKIDGDGFAFGWVRSFKQGVTHSWHNKTDRKASEEERAEWKRKTALAKALRETQEAETAKAAAVRADGIWKRAATTGGAGYLTRKGCSLHGARVWLGLVVVPLYLDGKISSLQFIAADGAKRFLKDGKKEGGYFPIATADEPKAVIVICEGFATGAALRESLGYPVVVAFDAGNLKPVAKAMRAKYPDARIIIAADSDQWTTKQDGTPWNPGVEGAQQAAVAIGGAAVIWPQVSEDDPDRRTDWDDIWRSEGADVVVAAFDMVLREPLPVERGEDYDFGQPDMVQPVEPFRCLGYNEGVYYFLPSCNGGQIVECSAAALNTMPGLGRLHSSHDYWQSRFGGEGINDRKCATLAGMALMDMCHREGVFRPEAVRGAGAWRDGTQMVVNDGRLLHAGGQRIPIYAWRGDTTYTADSLTYDLSAEPLGNADAVKFREICNRLTWEIPVLGDLFAGWVVVAPFASCFRWRAHGHLSGKSGAGKTWVLNHILKPMLGRAGILIANPTEALVRKRIGKSGRPVILDESEPESMSQRDNMQKTLHLMRAASAGAETGNSVETINAMSAFMLSSIGVASQHAADENRITLFALREYKRADKVEAFAALSALVTETITPEYSRSMQARVMQNLDALYDNEGTFRQAASELFGRQRNADQLAPMIAGLYMLTSTERISKERAIAWLKARDWSWHQTPDEDSDAHNFVRQLMTSRARYDVHGIARESTIGQMIEIAANRERDGYQDVCIGLKTLGIKVEEGLIWIANKSPGISRLMERTSWPTWYRTLGDYPGADNYDNKPVWFAAGLTGKVKRIPLAAVLEAPKPPVIDEPVPW